jgi:aminocarboxymuconate-semialdehyde decarboxylase
LRWFVPPTHYLRQGYLDTIAVTPHQLRYMLDDFGRDRILMGTDCPFDMAEHDPIGHIASVQGMDDMTMKALSGGNAIKALGLAV